MVLGIDGRWSLVTDHRFFYIWKRRPGRTDSFLGISPAEQPLFSAYRECCDVLFYCFNPGHGWMADFLPPRYRGHFGLCAADRRDQLSDPDDHRTGSQNQYLRMAGQGYGRQG